MAGDILVLLPLWKTAGCHPMQSEMGANMKKPIVHFDYVFLPPSFRPEGQRFFHLCFDIIRSQSRWVYWNTWTTMAKLKYALRSSKCLPEGLTTVKAKCVRIGSIDWEALEGCRSFFHFSAAFFHSCKIQHCTDVNTLLVLWKLPHTHVALQGFPRVQRVEKQKRCDSENSWKFCLTASNGASHGPMVCKAWARFVPACQQAVFIPRTAAGVFPSLEITTRQEPSPVSLSSLLHPGPTCQHFFIRCQLQLIDFQLQLTDFHILANFWQLLLNLSLLS